MKSKWQHTSCGSGTRVALLNRLTPPPVNGHHLWRAFLFSFYITSDIHPFIHTVEQQFFAYTVLLHSWWWMHLWGKNPIDASENIPQSAVSGIITKWKRLGTTAAQPRSGRPHKMTERGQRMLRRIVRRGRQLSAESVATDLQTLCGLQISSRTVHRQLHGMVSMVTASKPYFTNCNAKRRMQWCKARRHWTLEQWRRVLWSAE